MPISILMPALSPTMTEGNLIKWHKNKGDPVKAGDILAEIETDKATMEVEAVDEGLLGAVLVAGGTENVKVNTPIALLLEEGEGEGDLAKSLSALKNSSPEKCVVSGSSVPPEPSRQETAQAPSTVSPVLPETAGERLFASPLARRIASQNTVNLRDIQGSGPRGRIIKQDVLEALNRPIGGPLNIGAGESAFSGYEPPFQERSLSLMRKVIARRLTEAKQTVPHFYLSLNAKIDNLLEARRTLNQRADLKISVNDMVIQAVAKALARFPDVNVAWAGESLRVFERVDISVAVSIDTGLITPVFRDAHSKGLVQISAEMKDLVARARAGKLRPDEFQGGTFSLSNLGMFGIEQFSAIANPPQAGILAVGAGIPKAIVEEGEMRIATVMNLTLSLDHRAVDGALGAEFLREIKECLENPARMLL